MLSQTPHIHCELKEGRDLKNGFLFPQLHLNRLSVCVMVVKILATVKVSKYVVIKHPKVAP